MGTETENIFHSTSVPPGWDRTRTEPKWQIYSITNCNITTCYQKIKKLSLTVRKMPTLGGL